MPLGEVLVKSKEQVDTNPHEQYKQVTIKLWGQGVVLRDEVDGSSIAGSKRFVVRPQQFILSRIDARNGAFGLVPDSLDGAVVSNDFPAFTPNSSRLRPAFLGWMSKTRGFVDLCRAASEGTTNRVRLKEALFMSTKIPLPPLSEQQRIVARIEELAASIEEARGLRRQAVEESEALVSSEMTRLFSNAEQRGWQVKSLESYLVDTRYGTSQKTTDDDTGTPVLRMGNIQQGRLDLRDLKYLHLSNSELANLHLATGDVLVNRTNSAELVGKCAVFDLEEECVFASYLIRLRLDSTRIEPRLVALYLNSPSGRAYMQKEKTQMTGQANVNAKKLRAVPIALPSLSEQQLIVAYLDDLQAKVDSLKQLQAKTAAELDALLPSVLDRAFKGKL